MATRPIVWCRKLFFILGLLAVDNLTMSAQVRDTSSTLGNIEDQVRSDVKVVLADGLDYLSAPLRFSATDWMWTGAFLSATAGLTSADLWARNTAQRNPPSHFSATMLDAGRDYGSVLILLGASGGVYFLGIAFHDKGLLTTGRMMGEGVLLAGASRLSMGILTGRSRPYSEKGPHFFMPLRFEDVHHSMPSGHAAFAFTISTVLSNRLANPFLSVGLFALAGITGVSRISEDQHWLSDVVAGGVIGTVTGMYVIAREKARSSSAKSGNTGFRFIPRADGFSVMYVF